MFTQLEATVDQPNKICVIGGSLIYNSDDAPVYCSEQKNNAEEVPRNVIENASNVP